MNICSNFNRATTFQVQKRKYKQKIPHGRMDTLWAMVPRRYEKLSKSGATERFYMTSRRPYWCSKTRKWRPCWCPKPILWELNSFLM